VNYSFKIYSCWCHKLINAADRAKELKFEIYHSSVCLHLAFYEHRSKPEVYLTPVGRFIPDLSFDIAGQQA